MTHSVAEYIFLLLTPLGFKVVKYLLVGQGRYSVPIFSTLKMITTSHTDLPGQF